MEIFHKLKDCQRSRGSRGVLHYKEDPEFFVLISKEFGRVPCVVLPRNCSLCEDLEAGKLHELTLVLS